MLAIIRTGGKQYKVSEGDVLRVEKIEGEVGSGVRFNEVLLVGDDAKVTVGAPIVNGAFVSANITKQDRSKKVWGIKHKPKKREKTKFGHRQPFTEIQVEKIGA